MATKPPWTARCPSWKRCLVRILARQGIPWIRGKNKNKAHRRQGTKILACTKFNNKKKIIIKITCIMTEILTQSSILHKHKDQCGDARKVLLAVPALWTGQDHICPQNNTAKLWQKAVCQMITTWIFKMIISIWAKKTKGKGTVFYLLKFYFSWRRFVSIPKDIRLDNIQASIFGLLNKIRPHLHNPMPWPNNKTSQEHVRYELKHSWRMPNEEHQIVQMHWNARKKKNRDKHMKCKLATWVPQECFLDSGWTQKWESSSARWR